MKYYNITQNFTFKKHKKIIKFLQQNYKKKKVLKTCKIYNSYIYKFIITKIMSLLP